MAEFQRYQRSETVRPGGVSTGRAQGLQSLSNKLQSFANNQQNQADTEYSSQIDAYVGEIENDIISNVGRLSIDHAGNFDQFSASVQTIKEATLGEIEDGAIRRKASLFFDRKLVQYGETVYRKTQERKKIQETQKVYSDLEIHTSDTQNMITSAIRTGNTELGNNADFMNNMGVSVQEQRLYIANKLDRMPGLTTEAGMSKRNKAASNAKLSFYQSAVIEKALIAEEEGDNGATVLFDFITNPNKFFKKDPVLSVLFPEDNILLSEPEQTELFLKGMKMVNAQRENEEYIATQKQGQQQEEWDKQYSFFVENIAQSPELVDIDMITKSYEMNDLGSKEYNSLVNIIQNGSLFKEDSNEVSDLWNKLYDPGYPQSQLYSDIQEAVSYSFISVGTQKQMLGMLRDGSLKDITKSEDFSRAEREIETEFRTTGPLAAFDQGESQRINQAKRELYNRVREGEDPWEIIDGIKLKHSNAAEDAPTVSWNSAWVGSANDPNVDETEKMLGRKLKNKEINFETYSKEIIALEDYMKSYMLRGQR